MPAKPDVLFVVLDSARKARLSTYGHSRETTPSLGSLAERATVFENAYTPAPWTLPSHCSMFSGLFPAEHGITNGFTDQSLQVPDEFPTMPERLSDSGYRTAGFSNNPWVGELSGLNSGFDEYVEWDLELTKTDDTGIHRSRDELYSRWNGVLGRAAKQPLVLLKRRFFTSNLVSRAVRWIETTEDEPSFTFLNLMEAHSPYYPPRDAFRDLDLDAPNPVGSRLLNTRLLAYVMGKKDLTPDQRRRVMEYYDASLRYQDSQFQRLLGALRETGQLDDTLVVVCADHGKTLGEFDRNAEPPHYVREINVNVPLVVKWPGQRHGERVEEPAELANLFDVVTDDRKRQAGIDALTTDDGYAMTEDYVPHTGRSSSDVTRWRSLTDGQRTVVRNDADEEFVLAGSGTDEVLAPDGDPAGERELRRALDEREGTLKHYEGGSAEESTELRSEVEGQLEDLGYLE